MPNDRVLNFSEFADKYSQDTVQDAAASFSEFQTASDNFQDAFDETTYGDEGGIKPNRHLNQGEGMTPQQPGDEMPGETEGMEVPDEEEPMYSEPGEEEGFPQPGEEGVEEPVEGPHEEGDEEMEEEGEEEGEGEESEEEYEEDEDGEPGGNPEDEEGEGEEEDEDEKEEEEEESNESFKNKYGKSEKVLESYDSYVKKARRGAYDEILNYIELDIND